MSNKSDYTEQEWMKLAEAILLAPGNMMLNVGRAGITKGFRESSALLGGMKKIAKENYPDNELIDGLVYDENLAEPNVKSVATPDYQEALAAVKEAADIVARRTGSEQEIQEYKQFLIDLTKHVAQASGEGFMGSGEKLSQAEVDYIDTLKDTLGL